MMKKRTRILGFAAALILLASLSLAAILIYRPQLIYPQADHLPAGEWLVAGPFSGNEDNGLYSDYLSDPGETGIEAREGGIAAWGLTGPKRWQSANPSENGWMDFKELWPEGHQTVAYAYTELESDIDRYAVATIGSGTEMQIRLRGEVVYENRVFRRSDLNKDMLVLPLRKGINPVLVKAQRGLTWQFQWKVHFPDGKLFVNEGETVIPDFRVTEPVSAWGQVEVANASGAPLHDVVVELIEDDLVLASRSEKVTIGPEEVQRIPVWIAAKKAVAEDAKPKVKIRVTAEQEEYSFEVEPRVRDAKSYFVTTYRSKVDGSVQPFSVLLPPSFDEATLYPLIIPLHGSHVTTWGRNMDSYAPKKWAIQMAVHDRGNNDYREIGEVDIEEALAELSKRYRIDPDRMYLSGHSMGGYGTWFLATRYPDRWAAISPQTTNLELALDAPATRKAGNKNQQEFQKRLMQSWNPLAFIENLLHIPAYLMHGAKDKSVTVENSRKMAARLKELGYEHIYDENPEGGHWWNGDSKDKEVGVECVDKKAISDFFQKHGMRAKNPSVVIYKTDSLRYRRAYWVTIDELDAANRLASIKAEIVAANNIAAQVENIARFTLELNEHLIAKDQPLTVSINGHDAFRGLLPDSMRLTFLRNSDGSYVQFTDSGDGEINYSQDAGAIMKTEQIYGPVIDAFNEPFLYVVGTKGQGEEAERISLAARRAARAMARDWMTRSNGIVRIKSDVEVTPDDIASFNLILFGNAATNSLISQINDSLPIRFAREGIILAERTITAEDAGLIMIRPNPMNQRRYIVIVGGTKPHSFDMAARLRLAELPDYAIFSRDTFKNEHVELVDGGFFDKRWQIVK